MTLPSRDWQELPWPAFRDLPTDMVAPPDVPRLILRNAGVPRALLRAPAGFPLPEGGDVVLLDLDIADGRIVRLAPTGVLEGEGVDLDRGMVWPCFVDLHTHLDKGHIWPRAANPDGTRAGALAAVAADREANWNAEDVRARMDFALRCAFAQGTRAIRTHLDSIDRQPWITWPVFCEMREAWRGRIELQAVALFHPEAAQDDAWLAALADLVARSGGVMGGVPHFDADPQTFLDRVFGHAEARGLDLDFHVDETNDPGAACLRLIAETALRRGFAGRIVAGHCCSLALQAPEEIDRTLDLVARAGITVVSLPMCNMYLQDRTPGRTPRWRGVTLLHELRARGIRVAVASDNCRDPFYAYGDHDVMEVYREATRIAQLDHPIGDWPRTVTVAPATVAGFAEACVAEDLAADLALFRARDFNELFARPSQDRIVLRGGKPIARALPDYRELDPLMVRA
jgi:cytosine/creatinine deaminase